MKTEISKTLKLNRIITAIITLLGVILLIYMVKVEGEPGALPLLLIIGGSVWFFINRYQIKKQLLKKQ